MMKNKQTSDLHVNFSLLTFNICYILLGLVAPLKPQLFKFSYSILPKKSSEVWNPDTFYVFDVFKLEINDAKYTSISRK